MPPIYTKPRKRGIRDLQKVSFARVFCHHHSILLRFSSVNSTISHPSDFSERMAIWGCPGVLTIRFPSNEKHRQHMATPIDAHLNTSGLPAEPEIWAGLSFRNLWSLSTLCDNLLLAIGCNGAKISRPRRFRGSVPKKSWWGLAVSDASSTPWFPVRF